MGVGADWAGLWHLKPCKRAFQEGYCPGAGRANGSRILGSDCEVPSPRTADEAEALRYNAVQRAAYLVVIFVLFPLVIWTGLALSPAFDAAFPLAVNALGGRQSARTLHFLCPDFS